MKLAALIVFVTAVAYGAIVGYITAYGIPEWKATSMIWRALMLGGFFAFISFVTYVITYALYRP